MRRWRIDLWTLGSYLFIAANALAASTFLLEEIRNATLLPQSFVLSLTTIHRSITRERMPLPCILVWPEICATTVVHTFTQRSALELLAARSVNNLIIRPELKYTNSNGLRPPFSH